MHVRRLLKILMIELVAFFCGLPLKSSGMNFSNKSFAAPVVSDENKSQTNLKDAEISKSAQVKNNSFITIKEKEEQPINVKKPKEKNQKVQSVKNEECSFQTTTSILIIETETTTEIETIQIQENTQEVNLKDTQEEEIECSETNISLSSDYIIIQENVIPLVYGEANQGMVDTYEAVQDTGLIQNTNNTFIFGHNDRSFSILDSVEVFETICLNNFGETKLYQVERSELGVLTDDGTDIELLSDGSRVVYNDYGYPALVLITCARGFNWNYRWVIVAKELN